MSSQSDHLGVYLKQIFCVKGKAVSMKKLVAVLTVIVVLTGCVYDPVNYDKIHDQEFQDHLRQNG
ncbi:hypothetical protein G347_10586 [Acinetobacter baumannii MSP4-16]|uniref:Uncharacterized protein n=6 Tax=Acinetobacter baumannii TaxID=470 RepID=D0C725_ACIB2|nr:hypothetical protein HMPREF0010_00555 [Acinetobacter baumannii ATCC 19606 = CIP 70.34 = JCM 6841]EME56539.1 hypothetical protein G347_10586 [Acinetobacter baumannii MSP4-16]BCA99378.1 hypothetical protein ATCC19606_17140 [Acinetobacter baumannii]